jgi:hydroxymethylbilane synthase
MRLVIGSRGSALALWQARWVQRTLLQKMPGTEIEIQVIRTQGDDAVNIPFEQLPGKGFFVKEIEEALLAERIDLAVHSMKDLPEELPPGLCLAAITAREDPRDALVTAAGQSLEELPRGAGVGTGSPRRAAQLLARRPDLEIRPLRGNVDTRVRRLLEGRHDAVVLAAAGLARLEIDVPRVALDVEVCIPAVGQGALGIEVRQEHEAAVAAARLLEDATTSAAVTAERSFLGALGGGCRVPIAGFARLADGELELQGMVARADGSELIRDLSRGDAGSPREVGEALGSKILEQGGGELLQEEAPPA